MICAEGRLLRKCGLKSGVPTASLVVRKKTTNGHANHRIGSRETRSSSRPRAVHCGRDTPAGIHAARADPGHDSGNDFRRLVALPGFEGRPDRQRVDPGSGDFTDRSEEHTSELQSHSFISYAVFCLKKKT